MNTHTPRTQVSPLPLAIGYSSFVIWHCLLLAFLLASLPALHAQTVLPLFINYQGKVTDSAGVGLGTPTPLNRKVIFRIYSAATGGTLRYTEEQTVTLSGGEFSVLIGQGIQFASELKPALDTVFTSAGTEGRFLEITVDNGDGTINGSDAPITPRQQITTTAYSFRAGSADTVPASAIGTAALASSSVTLAKMAAASVNSSTIVDASIATGDLANSAVTLAKLAGNAVDSSKIVDGSIASADIADATIATADLANGAVTAAKLGSDVGLWAVSGANVYRSAGNVGIGTASPAHPLDVNGNIRTLGNLYVANTSGTSPTADPFRIDGFFDDLQIVNEVTSPATGGGIQLTSRGQLVMRVFDGKVGINNSTPGYALDVRSTGTYEVMRLEVNNGNEWVFAVHPASADLELKNNGGAVVGKFVNASGQYVQLSDRRAKTRIKLLEPVLDKVMRLQPSSYWLEEATDAPLRSLGFISQDVEELFPELISENIGGFKMLNYTGLIPVAVRAVQELKVEHDKTIAALNEANAALKRQIAEQQTRLAKLEARDEARDAKLAAIEAMLTAGKPAALPVPLKKVAAAE